MTLVLFILILSIIVLVHEFGHFIVAKKNGIRVEEFGMGLPPRLFGKKYGETLYSLNLLPFGGFVKLTGEDGSDDSNNADISLDSKSFQSKSALQKSMVLVAGVFMNLVLAVFLSYVFLVLNNFKTFQIPLLFEYKFKFGNMNYLSTVVSDIAPNSPAEASGVNLGEAIMSIDGVKVSSVADVRNILKSKIGDEVTITLLDLKDISDQNTREVIVIPISDNEGNGVLGVYLGKVVTVSYDTFTEKLFSGILHSYNMLDYSMFSMGKIIGLSFETGDISPVSESVSGPVGIYNLVGGILEYGGSKTFLVIIDYISLMSLSLAFINIMPFPALDGGRLLLVIIEKLRGKRLNPKVEMFVNQAGMLVLLGLLVLVTIKDLS